MWNHSSEAHLDNTGTHEPRYIRLLNEDLPEVMMEKLEMKKRGSSYLLPHLTFNLTDQDGDRLVDSSLLASLRVSRPNHSVFVLDFNSAWLHGVFLSFAVVLLLVFTARFYVWRRRHRRVASCRIDPSDEEQNVALENPPEDLMATEDFNTSNPGVSVPLLQEVTRLWQHPELFCSHIWSTVVTPGYLYSERIIFKLDAV